MESNWLPMPMEENVEIVETRGYADEAGADGGFIIIEVGTGISLERAGPFHPSSAIETSTGVPSNDEPPRGRGPPSDPPRVDALMRRGEGVAGTGGFGSPRISSCRGVT
jgi:hypothetical protein